jgi:hypothetical protein
MGSCQERPQGWSHGGFAYIWFPLMSQGQAFADLLKRAGIDYTVKEKPFGLGQRNAQGETMEPLTLTSLNVNFARKDFGRIAEALAQDSASP